MAESTHSPYSTSLPAPTPSTTATQTTISWRRVLLLSAVTTVVISLLIVQFDTFDAVHYPPNELTHKPIFVLPRVNPRVLHGSEKIGEGQLLGPEDIVHDPKLGVVYTSCVDGWVKRVRVNDSVVEDWVNTGGRPLGLALGYFGEVYVADAYKRYYIQGEKAGSIDVFIDRLPGMPDNIRYDGEGYYWIAIPTELTFEWDLARKYPYIRKFIAFLDKYFQRPSTERNAGVVVVDLDGKPIERYYDPELKFVTTGIKIGEHLYLGNLMKSYITRLNLTQYPATTTFSTK
ncbi:hypothetical protein M8C21_027053 [Ambrosia artemisiifolia]|uniref:Strictosidine synthase conserved region domain-containing protein n=1 Tax=Ambrosia artemisiifolia TaxID=4212 RepID=A0AAD5G795_AMBAR|nr:hypothetical protein M8C21_027053 [Ambrosia artemisiifolia]